MTVKNDLPIGFEMSLNEVLKERYNRALELQKQKPKDRDENNPELSRYEVTEKSVLVCDDGLICSYCEQGLGSYHKKKCDHMCKNIKIREVVEYIITVPSTWKEDEVEVYAELEGRRMGLFDYLELEKVIEVSQTYFSEEFRTHLL